MSCVMTLLTHDAHLALAKRDESGLASAPATLGSVNEILPLEISVVDTRKGRPS